MKTPHKHAELIKAWAEGETIEYFSITENKWNPIFKGWSWDSELYLEMRIKTEPKPDVVEPWSIYVNLNYRMERDRMKSSGKAMGPSWLADVAITWDGNTGKLKEIKLLEVEQ